jgi:O-antigen ligase
MQSFDLQTKISRSAKFAALTALLLFPVILFFARHSPSFLVGFAAISLAISMYFSDKWDNYTARLKSWMTSGWGHLLIVCCLYVCLSTIWSGAGMKGFVLVLQTISAGASVILLVAAFYEIDEPHFTSILMIGIMICALLLMLETSIYDIFKKAFLKNRRLTDTNRAAVFIALSIPMLLQLTQRKGWVSILAYVTLILAFVSVFRSESESAKLASIVAFLAFGGLYFFGRRLWAFILYSFIVLIGFAPFIYFAVHDVMGKSFFENFNYQTFGIRTKIWEAYARLVMLRPIIGLGAEGASTARLLPEVQDILGTRKEYLSHVHPHSIPLQIWVELGVIGCGLAVATVIASFKKLDTVADQHLPYIGALIAAVMSVSAVGHGAWQPWWPCLIAVCALGLSQSQRSLAR